MVLQIKDKKITEYTEELKTVKEELSHKNSILSDKIRAHQESINKLQNEKVIQEKKLQTEHGKKLEKVKSKLKKTQLKLEDEERKKAEAEKKLSQNQKAYEDLKVRDDEHVKERDNALTKAANMKYAAGSYEKTVECKEIRIHMMQEESDQKDKIIDELGKKLQEMQKQKKHKCTIL